MSKLNLKMKVFDEPELEFAQGQLVDHPATGLTLFGPVESRGIEFPRSIDYAVIGTTDGASKFSSFVERLNSPIAAPDDKSDALWPHFPGFTEAMHADFPVEPTHIEAIDPKKLAKAVNEPEGHKRVYEVASLYVNAIQALAASDARVDVAVCVVPEIVFKNCRPFSKVTAPNLKRTNPKERKLRRQVQDLFGAYDSRQYDYSLDFRRQIKARAMEHRMPIQIIRESTLRLSDENEFGKRGLTFLSDRAWNLSTAFLYKSGIRPWRLSGVRDGVCYVGIAFKRTEEDSTTACSAAQMFLNDGDGVVFLGDYGPWFSPDDKQCHLSREAANKLLSGVLETYAKLHGKALKEVFLHCRSTIDEEEWKGYSEACPEGVKLVGVRVASDRGLKIYRSGTRPVLRGTYWQVSDRACYLWASGFKPSLRTYEGSDVPSPLRIEVQHGDADIEQVARDIFGLTKLNYNACKLGESRPVTVHFSDAVGEILVANRGATNFLPNFKYYV